MATLQIDLFDQTNHRRLWVSLRDNLPIQDLIHKLIVDLELPQGQYELIDERSNQKLPMDSTLEKEGVVDRQILALEKRKRAPLAAPIPIPKPSKASAGRGMEAAFEKDEEGGERAGGEDRDLEDEKWEEREERRAQGDRRGGQADRGAGRLPKPPPDALQQGPTTTFWTRPLRRPGCLGWISFSVWRNTTPLVLLTFLLTMICCFLLGILVCFVWRQAFLPAFFAPAAAPPPHLISTSTPSPTPTATPKSVAECSDVIYTYENPSVLNDYQAGQHRSDPNAPADQSNLKEMVKHFGDWQGIVAFSVSPQDQPGVKTEWVLIAINGAKHPKTGNLYACLANPATGETRLAQMDLEANTIRIIEKSGAGEITWSQPKIESMEAYRPPQDRCWWYTYFLGFNIEAPPLQNVELRRALVKGFDTEAYMQMSFDSLEGIASGLAPDALLEAENLPPEDRIGLVYDLEEAHRLLEHVKASGWLSDYPIMDNFLYATYCNQCERSDALARDVITIWQRRLGVGGKTKGDKESEHYTPIAGTERQIYLMTLGSANYYDFIHTAISEGWIMLATDGRERVLSLLDQYAYEESPARRRAYINEIEYLIVMEYAAAIPINFFEGCEQ